MHAWVDACLGGSLEVHVLTKALLILLTDYLTPSLPFPGDWGGWSDGGVRWGGPEGSESTVGHPDH